MGHGVFAENAENPQGALLLASGRYRSDIEAGFASASYAWPSARGALKTSRTHPYLPQVMKKLMRERP